MNQKKQQSIYYENAHIDLMEKIVIQMNVDVNVKNFMYVKDYFCNPAACNCQNGKYLATIKDDSVIKFFDEIIDSYDETKKIQ